MKTFSPPFFCCLCRGFYFLFFSELAAVFPHSFRVSQPPISFYRFLLKRRPFSFLPFSSEHFYFVLVFPLFFIPQAQTGILNSFFSIVVFFLFASFMLSESISNTWGSVAVRLKNATTGRCQVLNLESFSTS